MRRRPCNGVCGRMLPPGTVTDPHGKTMCPECREAFRQAYAAMHHAHKKRRYRRVPRILENIVTVYAGEG